MREEIAKYAARLSADRSADADRYAFLAQDDRLISAGDPELCRLGERVLSRLSCVGLLAARPSLPFADLLVKRSPRSESRIVPRDTETRTFLHDIPFLRKEEQGADPAPALAKILSARKGVIAEGIGILATGPVTVEQAYIHYTSVFHAAFVKYLQDLLAEGFRLPGEEERFADFAGGWIRPPACDGLSFRPGPLSDPGEILEEIAAVGRYTVERGLVDSYFGNISCFSNGVIYISQTAASLDSLRGCIDPVPLAAVSTAGITASSELPAHRRIYETGRARTILHGHPRFSVVMSLFCEEPSCPVKDCWKDCDRVRYLGDTPIVAGEIGAGGLAKRVPPVVATHKAAIVYGHGVFTAGERDFAEPFRAMVEVENRSREEYFRRLRKR
ncbi:MAG: class II aldolase/adducin family protein [Deltaproteobacteria bacterium]